MKSRGLGLGTLVLAAVFAAHNTASAADLEGTWDVSVADGQGGSIDFEMDVTQLAVFIGVVEHRQAGDVNGSGLSPGPLVIWFDDAGSIFLGIADDEQQATTINGLIVINFESLFVSTWGATKQQAPPSSDAPRSEGDK